MQLNQAVQFSDIDKRVIGSEANYLLKPACHGALVVSVQHVALAAAEYRDPALLAVAGDCIVARFRRGGHNDSGTVPEVIEPIQNTAEQRCAVDRAEHLARQP